MRGSGIFIARRRRHGKTALVVEKVLAIVLVMIGFGELIVPLTLAVVRRIALPILVLAVPIVGERWE